MADLDGIVHEDVILGRLILTVRSCNALIRAERIAAGEDPD